MYHTAVLDEMTIQGLRDELRLLERRASIIRELLAQDGTSTKGRGRPAAENGESFASKVQEALASLGRESTTKEVVKALETAGVAATGKTPLMSLVSGELSRLARNKLRGVVSKKRGVYAVKLK